MARLIDADVMKNNIMEAMMRQFEKNGDQLALRIAEMMWHFIDVTDTVDAVPVVHGHWCWQGKFRACSKCGSYVEFTETLGASFWKFCPFCGAKMDGDGNG